ncbi:MAG: bifunctional aspartate kinase/homoserine dehydrogenase I [Bacteroidetes bacterium]|nr:bifunctional aspartate kinase/homoserine dehydrogenase I [Bacteroidota bacterium]MCH8524783.1 bifunctional aspartate kinase/homoserine dehydrogenase I [Balneolales bacterium]
MLHILKFGGSSVAYPERIQNSVEIVRRRLREVNVAVVVSALGGVTDELIAIMDKACVHDEGWKARYENLVQRHHQTVDKLTSGDAHSDLRDEIDTLLNDLLNTYQTIHSTRDISPKTRDYVLSFGERMSSRIFAAALNTGGIKAKAHESQHFVRTNNRFGDADVDYDITRELVNKALGPINGTVPVITGFLGSTIDNEITTLGRSGSDFTAGLMGQALDANLVEIWTDVNGVLTADPNIASTAVTIPRLHYAEIAEMAHFGTKVLHPRTVLPLEEVAIPIGIYNSFEPDHPGTLITHEYSQTNGTLKSVSLKKDVVLIGVKSKGLDRIQNLLTRAMRALLEADITVLFNSAASAEFGITFAIDNWQSEKALSVLEETFSTEYRSGLIDEPTVLDEVNMVTVIGDRLVNDLGLSGAVLSVLGENQIAPLATAKGVGNRHFSMILPKAQSFTAVRLLNDHFCVHAQRVRLFVAGATGIIGSELLQQITEAVNEEYDLSVIGICDKRSMYWSASGMVPLQASELLETGAQETDWGLIINRLITDYPYRTIFIDCTGAAEVSVFYNKLLKAGIHVATLSKRANTASQAYFDELMHYTEGKRTHYLYETTAGAGLPVFQTLKDLIRSGDQIQKITGVLSGTLTYLFDALLDGDAFGKTIKRAREMGYAEPDPRDDLSGKDAAWKLLGIARSIGMRVEIEDMQVEDLVPESLRDVSLETFFASAAEFDDNWKQMVRERCEPGHVLRYVGTLEGGKIKLEVQSVPRISPMGALGGIDNQISIYTKRYNRSPLTVQGPGAGKEVTAAGLLADVQKIAIRIVR